MSDTRDQQHEVEIAAPADAVWRALTDEEELTRWYVEDATFEPRAGGPYRVSWGELGEGTGRVEVWEPQCRLRLVAESLATADEPIVEEYTIATRGGTTLLRLVHSGIPAEAEWDAFYDGTNVGWALFLAALRHYLERHPGKRRHFTVVVEPVALPPRETWAALSGPDGYRAAGLAGDLLVSVPGRALLTTVAGLDDGLLELAVAPRGEQTQVYSMVAAFGDDGAPHAEAVARWRERIALLAGG
jgi:uncharacterized protein YndB with AHSA1/START domain